MTMGLSHSLREMPTGVWVLGLVSLFMDLSSEMIHSLLPVFLVTTLGASATLVGVVEGLAESLALIIKVFSGVVSDYLRNRKWLAVGGYGLGALSKPLFAVASGVEIVLTARLLDRVGKGIRGAPRDALVADLTPVARRGAAFGLRQSLDTIGAFLGPILAVGFMLLWAEDIRAVFWLAVLPAMVSVALLIFGIQEPAPPPSQTRTNPVCCETLARLPPSYWSIVRIGVLFTLARFSEAFLVLRGQETGISMALVPLVIMAMNIVYAGSAYPFGHLADRMSQTVLLRWGLLVLIAADLVLGLSVHWILVGVGVMLWGLHMGMTQGLLAAMVAQTAPAELRGTAFGLFNLASGVAMLVASLVAGVMWDMLGPLWTFYSGAAFATMALVALLERP
ncbi:MFS transporter [Nitrospira sp. BLG_1]|uniref:MFS transporter n=1 Tax=Nitrospira sp. BLG_1 TaxID=3395883 RepID=UPI0039BCC8DF